MPAPLPVRAGKSPAEAARPGACEGARPGLPEGAAGPPGGRPEGARAVQKALPGVMREVAARHPEAARVEPWFMDEARVGPKGRVTRARWRKGARPRGVPEHRFASAHRFGAVGPERDVGVAPVLPEVSTAAGDAFLAELGRVLAGGHAAVVDVACDAWNALLAEPGRLHSLPSLPGHPRPSPVHGGGLIPNPCN